MAQSLRPRSPCFGSSERVVAEDCWGMGPAGPLEPGSEGADALPHYLARRPRARHESPTAKGHQPFQGLEEKKENI